MGKCKAFTGVCILSLLFLNDVRVLAGHIIPEYQLKRSVVFPEDLERKSNHERVPSLDTYQLLTQYYGFICHQKDPGYYGDPNYDCRIFHVCQPDGRRDTFFCPAWTRFNNQFQICDWQHKVDDYCHAVNNPHETTDTSKRYLLPSMTTMKPEKFSYQEPGNIRSPDEKYSNKYQEQEYYKSIYDQQQAKPKFVLEDQTPAGVYQAKRTVLIVPNPAISLASTYPNSNQQNLIPGDSSVQEDSAAVRNAEVEEISVVISESPPALRISSSTAEDNNVAQQRQSAPQSKYDFLPNSQTNMPSTNGYEMVLQNPIIRIDDNRDRGNGKQGQSVAALTSAAGNAHTTEVDRQRKSVHIEGYQSGPVIELWIPT